MYNTWQYKIIRINTKIKADHKNCKNLELHIIKSIIWIFLKIKAVYYPGLESHPHHKIAKSQMKYFSGMISFEIVGGKEDAVKLVEVSVELIFYIIATLNPWLSNPCGSLIVLLKY